MVTWNEANTKARKLANTSPEEQEAYVVDEMVALVREVAEKTMLSPAHILRMMGGVAPISERIARRVRQDLGLL